MSISGQLITRPGSLLHTADPDCDVINIGQDQSNLRALPFGVKFFLKKEKDEKEKCRAP